MRIYFNEIKSNGVMDFDTQEWGFKIVYGLQ